MPYIKESLRLLAEDEPTNAGELNYAISNLFNEYLKRKGGLSYQVLNDIVGAGFGAVTEFQRRVVAPYEDKKIKENGDVYTI